MNSILPEQLKDLLEKLALEIALVNEDSTSSHSTIMELLDRLLGESEGKSEWSSFFQCAKELCAFMRGIVESAKPFSSEQLKQFNETLAKLKKIPSDESSGDSEVSSEEKSSAPKPTENTGATAQEALPIEDAPIILNVEEDGELILEFNTEGREHLDNIEQGLLVLEENPTDADTLNTIFRAFHTFKGSAGFLNLIPVNRLAHDLESLLDLARQNKLLITSEITDLILKGADCLKKFVNQMDEQVNGRKPVEPIEGVTAPLRAAVRAIISNTGAPPKDQPSAEAPPQQSEPSEASAAPVEEAVAIAEKEFAGLEKKPEPDVKKADPEPVATPVVVSPAPASKAPPPKAASKPTGRPAHAIGDSGPLIKVATQKLDGLIDLVGELMIAQSLVTQDEHLTSITDSNFTRNLSQMARITMELQRNSMALRMVPIRSAFQKMVRVVRDLASKEHKQVHLVLKGEDTELDRNVVEALNDPLLHMIRNSTDHGIEGPEERIAAGKSASGTITMSAFHQGGNIVVEIVDDGKGIDKDRVLAKAIENGLATKDASLTDEEIFAFILAPGFSTAKKVTDISGRGVGMDVVRRNIEKLRGRVDIRSTPGKGSVFTISLPLTLAIIDGLVLGVGEHRYILPALSVRESFRPTPEMIFSVQGKGEMVNVRGQIIPLLRMHEYFGLKPENTEPSQSIGVVVSSGGDSRCLLVDRLLNKQEVVIKSLSDVFKENRALAGAAILGDGSVGLILDPNTLTGLDSYPTAQAA